MKEQWRSHMTAGSIHLLTKCLLCPNSTSTLLHLPFLRHLCSHLHFWLSALWLRVFFVVFVLFWMLTEPGGRFRGCLGAFGLEEEAAMSEFPLVPWTCLPGDADLQQYHHIRRGEKYSWLMFVLFLDQHLFKARGVFQDANTVAAFLIPKVKSSEKCALC